MAEYTVYVNILRRLSKDEISCRATQISEWILYARSRIQLIERCIAGEAEILLKEEQERLLDYEIMRGICIHIIREKLDAEKAR
jgi:hypothetical protein